MEGEGDISPPFFPISQCFLHSPTGKLLIDGVELIIGVPTIFHVQFSFSFLFLVCRFLHLFLIFLV